MIRATSVGLTALVVLFGLQTLRTLLPLLVFVFRDRFDWGATAVGLLVFAVFATGFLGVPLRRALGGRRLLWITIGGLGLLRLAVQLWTGDPLVDFCLCVAAAACFFLALPALLVARETSGLTFALGWAVGLAVDTALHGAYGTWDMSWRSDLSTAAVVLVLVGLLGWSQRSALSGIRAEGARGLPHRVAWTWMAAGPFVLLELMVLGNVARLTTLTGWSPEAASAWVLAGQLGGVGAVVLVGRRRLPWPAAALLAVALTGAVSVVQPAGWIAALLLLAAQVASAALLAQIVLAVTAALAAEGLRRLAWWNGWGQLAFAALLFLYFAGIDLRLPFDREILPPIAAAFFGVAAVAAGLAVSRKSESGPLAGRAWAALVLLLALPLAKHLMAPEVRAVEAKALPLRLMTFNLHCGVDPRGHLGLEAVAQAIEAEDADVVALQEVVRGWAILGTTDVLAWLSRRLGMPHVFAPTAGPLWGNALLSRRPLLEHRALVLPTGELLIQRGFLSARVDLGGGEHLDVVATHYHHRRGGGAVRELQSRAMLDFWRGRERTAILGDLNAEPGEPEIKALRSAGLRDVLDLGGVTPGYTYPSTEPTRRIDYIWISPDLTASDVVVPAVPVSDHLPVAATIATRTR